MEVSKLVTQIPIETNLKQGYARFFKGQGNHPRFKKKGIHDTCQYDFPKVSPGNTKERKVFVPKLGWVRMAERLRFNGRICSFTISRVADMWYISIVVDVDQRTVACENQGAIGVDLGIKSAVVLSDGAKYDAPKPLVKNLKKLELYQRRLSRKQKGSKNRYKQQLRVARLHFRIANIRRDFWHKTTTEIASKYNAICMEDLNVSGMLKNRHLSMALSDVAIGSFFPLIDYKVKERGGRAIQADRWFASTKTCSSCGYKNNEITLADREWVCPECGEVHDRDVNAAKNLVRQILPELTPLEITPAVTQCAGEELIINLN